MDSGQGQGLEKAQTGQALLMHSRATRYGAGLRGGQRVCDVARATQMTLKSTVDIKKWLRLYAAQQLVCMPGCNALETLEAKTNQRLQQIREDVGSATQVSIQRHCRYPELTFVICDRFNLMTLCDGCTGGDDLRAHLQSAGAWCRAAHDGAAAGRSGSRAGRASTSAVTCSGGSTTTRTATCTGIPCLPLGYLPSSTARQLSGHEGVGTGVLATIGAVLWVTAVPKIAALGTVAVKCRSKQTTDTGTQHVSEHARSKHVADHEAEHVSDEDTPPPTQERAAQVSDGIRRRSCWSPRLSGTLYCCAPPQHARLRL